MRLINADILQKYIDGRNFANIDDYNYVCDCINEVIQGEDETGISYLQKHLPDIISDYFDIGDSYAYNLTRDKTAFSVGTMSLEDFEEFNDETVNDLVNYIINKLGNTDH